MARRRPPTADAHLRALRREAATVASELARSLQHAPAEIETFVPLVIEAFRDSNSHVFSEIDDNQARYEGREESWFCLMRQVRTHSEWGPRLFEALRSADSEITGASASGAATMIPWDEVPDVLPELGPHPLDAHEDCSRLRLTLHDGRRIEGLYNLIARQHFLHCTGPGMPVMGQVEGPLLAGDIGVVEVVMTRTELRDRGRELMQGPRVPGREPVTRDDFEHRLQTLARAVAAVPEAEWQMQIRLKRQFEACAKRIQLTPGKRAWLLAEAKWADLWVEPVASPSCFARPRPQDFDPDSTVRRRRTPLPHEVRADPHSVSNVLSALAAEGLKARITRLGDPPHERGHIQVEMPVKGRARFVLQGGRGEDGRMHWRSVWDGNESKAGRKRFFRAVATPAYAAMVRVLRDGRRVMQPDLFARCWRASDE